MTSVPVSTGPAPGSTLRLTAGPNALERRLGRISVVATTSCAIVYMNVSIHVQTCMQFLYVYVRVRKSVCVCVCMGGVTPCTQGLLDSSWVFFSMFSEVAGGSCGSLQTKLSDMWQGYRSRTLDLCTCEQL